MKTSPIITKIINTYIRYIVGGVVVVVLIVGYLVLLAPKIAEIRSSDVTAKQNAEADLAVQKKYVAALQESNAKFDQTLPASRRSSIDTFIPSDPDFPGLLLTVKNMVSQAQLNLDSITVSASGQQTAGGTTASTAGAGTTPTAQAATVAGIALATQDVNITVSGGSSYEAFKRLLTIIESSQRLFDIINVSFALPGQSTTTTIGSASWSLVLRTYYLPTL